MRLMLSMGCPIPHRYGHAHGIYKDDVSNYVTGFIFGRNGALYSAGIQ